MGKWSYPSWAIISVGAFIAGLTIGGSMDVGQANAEVPQGPQDPGMLCVMRNIEKIQRVHGTETFSPLTWLIEECRKNPMLHG